MFELALALDARDLPSPATAEQSTGLRSLTPPQGSHARRAPWLTLPSAEHCVSATESGMEGGGSGTSGCAAADDPPAEPPTPYEGMSNRQLRGEARRRGLRGQPHIGRGNRRNALIDFLRRGSLDNLEDCWVERQ